MPRWRASTAAPLRTHSREILCLRSDDNVRAIRSARFAPGPHTQRVVAHFVERELVIPKRPTKRKGERVSVRSHNPLPTIALNPVPAVRVITDTADPPEAVTRTWPLHDVPIEPSNLGRVPG